MSQQGHTQDKLSRANLQEDPTGLLLLYLKVSRIYPTGAFYPT